MIILIINITIKTISQKESRFSLKIEDASGAIVILVTYLMFLN